MIQIINKKVEQPKAAPHELANAATLRTHICLEKYYVIKQSTAEHFDLPYPYLYLWPTNVLLR
ncbi:hypothetical protein [Fodinibius sp.]|uniref:hypothetical protein n=1 Tax=Fodinibius sp. TaxID=1872440 RepID=UPI0035636DC2